VPVFVLVWEFVVRPEAESAFELLYGPDGGWARLFSAQPGFVGTELLRAHGPPPRYLTVDRWESRKRYESFRRRAAAEYEGLDREGQMLTESERFVGAFVAVGQAP
jgi:heme-degrading monooxygenase HmoA